MSALPDLIHEPARLLEGKELPNGWTVIERVTPSSTATGGYFSVGYLVEKNDGTRGFLKAFDFSAAHKSTDPLRELQRLLHAYNFERDLLGLCKERRLTKVAMALEDGSVEVPGAGILSRVYYVIFERADGDARSYVDFERGLDVLWRLRTLHHCAVALQQLHKHAIAHQDLKPSNILVFGSVAAKLGDLGRASRDGVPAPHDDLHCAGQRSYAPIELLYRHLEPDFRRRRLSTDLYLLGSLILFFFGNIGMTTALLSELDPAHRPNAWAGDFRQVLPYVRSAFVNVCTAFRASLKGICDDNIANDLTEIVRYLCDPDPQLRGHPLNRRQVVNQYSMERFVTRLNVMTDRAFIQRK